MNSRKFLASIMTLKVIEEITPTRSDMEGIRAEAIRRAEYELTKDMVTNCICKMCTPPAILDDTLKAIQKYGHSIPKGSATTIHDLVHEFPDANYRVTNSHCIIELPEVSMDTLVETITDNCINPGTH